MPFMEEEKARNLANGVAGDGRSSAGKIVLATVKGDVHDIGKNIVGIVLQCNNFEVIDLGVMVPAAKIVETVKAEKADIVGLSGLITPSLDEMAFFASELEREGLSVPLLIGGATTSRVHTAVKIDPNYRRGPVVHVNDASRAVGVASSLMSPEKRESYAADVRAEYAKISAAHFRAQADKKRLKLAAARANAVAIDFAKARPVKPAFLGVKSFDNYDLAELADYIDWTPFFQTWELAGRFPAILDDAKVGEAARALYDDARKMLDRIVREKWFTARAADGFWPANADGDDIAVYADEARTKRIATLHTLRQQLEKREGRFNAALADFIAPATSGVPDYIGGFVVTAGIGEDVIADRFKHANDDYSSILCKALADRLAEAFAERMHARVRREFWGYAPDEGLSPEDLLLEKYQGIRPAPGYPAQPDHTEKATLFKLLDAEANSGVRLTESFAMWPGSSVSGLYFSSPESYYFGVGKIERDQVEDYAARKNMTVAEIERWLAPILNYIPAQDQSAQERAVRAAMPAAVEVAAPANDISSHPPGCACAVHLAWRKKAVGAG
jgi:5-methyltetrahydrofolate--homocysteine methyltransferase